MAFVFKLCNRSQTHDSEKMILIFQIFFQEIFGQNRLNANPGMINPDILDGMKFSEKSLDSIQPRFNASCDEWSLNAAKKCEAGFAIISNYSRGYLPKKIVNSRF